jgi:hypothetical protein
MPRAILKEDGFKILKEDGGILLLEEDWSNEPGAGSASWTQEPGGGGGGWTPVDGGVQSWTRVSGD